MEGDDFVEIVRKRANLASTDTARNVSLATLETLGEHLADTAAGDVAASLPEEFGDALVGDAGPPEGFSFDEFLDRVADRADVPEAEALVPVRAVLATLAEVADDDAVADARAQLPGEFETAFDAGTPMTEDEFVAAVRRRAGLASTDDARAATHATLRTLGERLSRGEADDLATYLPDGLGRALTEASPDQPPTFDFEEFLGRVADRTDVDTDAVRDRARAVSLVLAEAAGETELREARSQLPREFDALFESDPAE